MIQKRFALIGAAGYIAPRHLKAIQYVGGDLVAALDPHDSVGILDSYFPNAAFFTEFERFDRHIEKLKQKGKPVDYIVVCSPNYLHDAHCRYGLRYGADVICEKPIVLNPWNIDALLDIEKSTGKSVYNILQLRLHKDILALKQMVDADDSGKIYDLDLTYITSRGNWYYASWKGQEDKSGGVATNIGIHFFDMLLWVFGENTYSEVHLHTHDRAAGYLEFEKARVKWFLSIDYDTLPEYIKSKGQRTYRSILIDDKELEFSEGFSELHDLSYEKISQGDGFRLASTFPSLNLVHKIRTSKQVFSADKSHSFVSRKVSKHPFLKG